MFVIKKYLYIIWGHSKIFVYNLRSVKNTRYKCVNSSIKQTKKNEHGKVLARI
jgi:hypothetical protein